MKQKVILLPTTKKKKQLVNAVRNGNLRKVTTLLKSGVSPDTTEIGRKQPVPVLVIAAFKGRYSLTLLTQAASARNETKA